jgi:hypothetical protein
MDLTPLLCIIRVMEQLLLLLCGLPLRMSAIFVASTIPMICSIDLSIILLFLSWWALVMWFKELDSGLGGLNANVNNYKHISHHFRLFHGNLFHGLDITDSIAEGIDDFNVQDVWDSVPGIAETFHIVSEAFIMLLLDGL